MVNRVMIVGTGNVGASIGYALLNQKALVNELILTDLNMADAEGEAMDFNDCLAVTPSFMKIYAGGYDKAKNCDIVIITAGAPQKPGETRMELLEKNAKTVHNIVLQVMASGFDGIFIVVTNPLDVMTHLVWKISGLPTNRVIGSGTVLDSARLKYRVANFLNLHPKNIHAYQIGEHGDTEFALWSSATVGGQPLNQLLSAAEMERIEIETRNAAYDIIDKKGATYYGIGACVTDIVNCILGDEKRVLPVSSYDDITNVYNGFPTVLGRDGVIKRLNLNFSETEKVKMAKTVQVLRDGVEFVERVVSVLQRL